MRETKSNRKKTNTVKHTGDTLYKAQYKTRSPYESWTTLGMYGTESTAISSAIQKKQRGALLVRVVDKRGAVVYVQ
jgi:hypothetical protein